VLLLPLDHDVSLNSKSVLFWNRGICGFEPNLVREFEKRIVLEVNSIISLL